MTARSDDYRNHRVYADWVRALVHDIFGDRMELHNDLYERTHEHRIEHGRELGGEEKCGAYPSPPARAPMWYLLTDRVGAKRFLELGCALGYTAALMADSGGPESHVDAVENNALHADLAESELSSKGLGNRVRVLRGEAKDILPDLTDPYDVVFLDGGHEGLVPDLTRLTRQGGVLIDSEVKSQLFGDLKAALTRLESRLGRSNEEDERARAAAQTGYGEAVENAIKTARSTVE